MVFKLPQMVSELRRLDALAYKHSLIHDLDPRAKLLTTLIYIVVVLSFDKYSISALLPLVLFPVILIALAGLPLGFIASKLALVAPFVLLIGIANPILDHEPFAQIGSITINAGWASLTSIIIRFVLTVTSAVILISTTGFHGVCTALHKLGMPSIMALQLLMLQRFMVVLIEEVIRVVRARNLRSFQGRGLEVRVFASIVGHLLLRTIDRAQRIYLAMRSRGFERTVRLARKPRIGFSEVLFTLGWTVAFIAMRVYNFSQMVGTLLMRMVG